ncbi:hypothetical protein M422DRAFT_263473 [Sphaerobolus stellatus SS14]|uniref:Uncharacterized protein n=1 Tax=Sphaerobolus stellatus (strain SS14) TaxID=990650 RepID=A0A0C9UI21_SPHS4|nr:hypothetical protein M422DRAFT_263473 [Sphaerobolus stellatus SS14]
MEAGEISGHLCSYGCSLLYLTLWSTHPFSTLGSPPAPAEHPALSSSAEASLKTHRPTTGTCRSDNLSDRKASLLPYGYNLNRVYDTGNTTYLVQYGDPTRVPRARIWYSKTWLLIVDEPQHLRSCSHQEDISVRRRPSLIEDSTAYGRTSLTQDELPIRLQQAKTWCSKTWLLVVDEPQQHHRSCIHQENMSADPSPSSVEDSLMKRRWHQAGDDRDYLG